MSRRLAYAIVKPIQWLGKWWWRRRRNRGEERSDCDMELLMNTGAFTFVARKPAESDEPAVDMEEKAEGG